jgi:hypothetical protein
MEFSTDVIFTKTLNLQSLYRKPHIKTGNIHKRYLAEVNTHESMNTSKGQTAEVSEAAKWGNDLF